ncbi:MAG: MBL fold metallo-hydrolase [Candidatus Taylorbacteria bacterium]|nr:MBL fold metallo-hydrolase [Candidatus Taylorbacteria bacterium]
MRITKLGHCCLIIEENGVRIMTDPGAYSTLQSEAKDIDFIFITHEHHDHLHIESLKTVLTNNPKAKIVTNKGVGKLLDAEGIPYQLLEHGGAGEFSGIHVEGCGEKHAVIYQEFGLVQNTGYFFANRFFYPGDAFYNPQKPVEILALPVAGGWVKISEATDYAKLLKPKVVFPVHDGGLKIFGGNHAIPEKFLPPEGITFTVISVGETQSF